ncbi:MAG: ribosome silencing factor [Actinomycetota bacterium]|nr:ribosome silencing factor [Actinomycetota bacterium]
MSQTGGIPTHTENDRGLEDVRRLARVAARAAAAKGASDTVILEVGQVLGITDAFVITSGRNHRQVKTMAEEVEAQVKAAGGPSPLRVEGADEAEWVLLDYGDFVVHAFLEPVRAYYELERLWSDAPRLEWEEDVAAARSSVPPSR